MRLKRHIIELRNINRYRFDWFLFNIRDMNKFPYSFSEILLAGDRIRAALFWRTIRVPAS
jgi:hypothetical protein